MASGAGAGAGAGAGGEYQVPQILNVLRKFIDFPRRQYSTDFSDFVIAATTSSSDSNNSTDGGGSSSVSSRNDAGRDEEIDSYRFGLILLGAMVLSVLVLWLLVLLVLKCNGKTMGCAAGRSFRGKRIMENDNNPHTTATNNNNNNPNSRRGGAHVSGESSARQTSTEEEDEFSSSSSGSSLSPRQQQQVMRHMEQEMEKQSGPESSVHEDDVISLSSSIRSSELDENDDGDDPGDAYNNINNESYERHSSRKARGQRGRTLSSDRHNNNNHHGADDDTLGSVLDKPTRRERRTQIAFFVLGTITLACVPLILFLFFTPLKTSTAASTDIVISVRDVVNQVDSALGTIGTAASMSKIILETTPTNFSVVCPKINETEAELYLGIEDLDDMILLLEQNYHALVDQVSKNVSQVSDIVHRIDKSVALVEDAYEEADKYIWIVPGLLLAVCGLTAMAMFGVVLSWKRQSNRRMQRILSYGVLPALIVFSVACWILAAASVITTAMTSDACTEGSATGTPDATIDNIILDLGVDPNGTVYDFANAYTGGCALGEEPTVILDDLEDQVQYLVDTIWRYLSSVDSMGRTNLMDACGGYRINDFLGGARDLAKLLTSVRRAIASLSSALDCSSVYPIYTKAVNESVCTDTASALGWGFLLFFLMGVTTMGMISLRASWRHKIEQDQIYDEDDVAENMFVDEHEEYLAYISKYKHEWEEYEGVNVVAPDVAVDATAGAASSANASSPHRRSQGEISPNHTSAAESEMSTGSRTSSSDSLTEYAGNQQGRLGIDEQSFTDDDYGDESTISYEHRVFDPYQSSTDVEDLPSVASNTDEISFLSLALTPSGQQSSDTGDNVVIASPAPLLQRSFQRPGCEDVDGIPPPVAPPSTLRISSPKKKPALTVSTYKQAMSPRETDENDFVDELQEEKKEDDDNDDQKKVRLEEALMLESPFLSTSEEPSPMNHNRLDLLLQSTSASSNSADERTSSSGSGLPSSFLPSTDSDQTRGSGSGPASPPPNSLPSTDESAIPSSTFLPSADESSSSPSSFLEPYTFLELSINPSLTSSSIEATHSSEAAISSPTNGVAAYPNNTDNHIEKRASSSPVVVVSTVPKSPTTTTVRSSSGHGSYHDFPPARLLSSSPSKTRSRRLSPQAFDSQKSAQSPASSYRSLPVDIQTKTKHSSPRQSLRAELILKELDGFYDGLQRGAQKGSPSTSSSGPSGGILKNPPKLVRSISVPKLSSSGEEAEVAVHFLVDDSDGQAFSHVQQQVDRFSRTAKKSNPRATPAPLRQKHHLTAMFDSPQT